ncbi:NADH:flavin oxidoreductase [Paenibacillus sp. PsM32]|uniref:NADH:flavin oxidoreductase n=1 Tax=Paenibacillus sp. PsM32 TaxID=3030536 RepID=UPI00263BC35E|nr:NADH:flavin oxidoreductase [Paenibacillus sp. PsM32]MDN4618224.1 NADH:flavin oxidoreductase [Paenibacillus sp. PsM32]
MSVNSPKTSELFTPFHTTNLELSNRIVMAPMTRNFSPNGVPGADVATYYRRRAENEVALIITEGTAINHPAAVSSPDIPVFHGEEALNGWAEVVKQVHEVGGKIMPQIWHVGMARPVGSLPNVEAQPIGPSGLDINGEKVNEPLTKDEIQEVIQAYAQAAADAKRVGFDGIELHGAHGYLIDQFFWSQTNQRTDEYGGDLVARTRFGVEVVKACRAAVGPDYPIVFRFSQWKMNHYDARLVETAEELAQFLQPLSEAGVDIFHCSTRRFWEPEFEGSDLNLAGWTKKITGKPTITVGSVGLNQVFLSNKTEDVSESIRLEELDQKLNAGEFDLVAVGRALIGDAAWATKLHEQRTDDIKTFDQEDLKSLK